MCPVHHPGKDGKRNQERLRFTTYRLRAFVWLSEMDDLAPLNGFSFVSDFSTSGAGLYLRQKISPGSAVRIAFESQESVTFKSIIRWEKRISLQQQFFGQENFSHRVGAKFLFGSEAERQRYLKFLEELKARVLIVQPGMKF